MSKACVLALLGCFWGISARAAETIEARGEATILGSDTVSAKKSAVADALRHAVEQAVGFQVVNNFTAEQREVTKNDKTSFDSSVRDNIVQKSEGFVESYDVTDEKRDGNVLRVTVRAKIVESKLRAELDAMTRLLAKAGNPRVAVVVTENHAGKPHKGSSLGSQVEKGLAERGFIVLAPEITAKIISKAKAGGKGDVADDAEKLAAAARDAGADIVVAGHVEVTDLGVIKDGEFESLKGQHKIEIDAVIRGIQVATAEVTSATPIKTTSFGIDVERAIQRAFVGRGMNVVQKTLDELVPGLKAALHRTAEQGQRYVLRVTNITSYRAQGMGLVDGLKAAAGVNNATQRSFEGGVLVVDVACGCSGSDLQARVFELARRVKELSSIDLVRVAGSQLEFKL
ncbi:MAG: flagellar assembly protein T N-terminal domain-containing protein [Myxococcota bacterium]